MNVIGRVTICSYGKDAPNEDEDDLVFDFVAVAAESCCVSFAVVVDCLLFASPFVFSL